MKETQVSKSFNRKNVMNHKTMRMQVGSSASKVRFIGWRDWSRRGESWLHNLCSTHQPTWKNAGIYDAIMVSKYPISRNDDLILELASRWCSETNTFIFPWGEATITLEDVMVLGGFSASGVKNLSPLENDVELVKIEERLELVRKEVQRGKSRKASQSEWMKKFMGNKSEVEHEAFLVYWLSRFVFLVGSSEVINRHVYHIAIQLSRGIKLALAHHVLGMLYKELTALSKRLMDMALLSNTSNTIKQLDLLALFPLVQIWAWERLPSLSPMANRMCSNGRHPRTARWSKVKILKVQELRSAIDSSEKSFVWCPYDECDKDNGIEPNDWFAQCIRTRKLEGLNCVEKYQPQRVARQFGLIQDIPTDHGKELTSQVTSKDGKLYMTSRLAKPTVTPRYEEWWKLQRLRTNSSQVKVEDGIQYGPPPGFPPRIKFITIDDSESDDGFTDAEEDHKLPSAYPSSSKHVPATKNRSESSVSSYISGFTDDESTESELPVELAIDGEYLSLNEEKDAGKCTGSNEDPRDGTHEDKDKNKSDGIASTIPHAMNCDAESFTYERSEDSELSLEARITRLEEIVYAHIRNLEETSSR